MEPSNLSRQQPSELVELLAPTFQRFLTGPVAARAASPPPWTSRATPARASSRGRCRSG